MPILYIRDHCHFAQHDFNIYSSYLIYTMQSALFCSCLYTLSALGIKCTCRGGFAHRLKTLWPSSQSWLSFPSFMSKLNTSRARIVRNSAHARLFCLRKVWSAHTENLNTGKRG